MSLLKKILLTSKAQVLVLLGVCLLIYGQTIWFDYVWDDGIIFLDKNDLVVQPLTWELIAQPVLTGTSYFRPLIFLTWFTEFHFFGQNPRISHAVNLFFFCLNVILVRAVAHHILQHLKRTHSSLWGTLAAMLYAAHPALIESTAWVAGRFDLMCTTFILTTCWVFLQTSWPPLIRTLIISCGTMMALLCKELGIVTPALLLCLWMALHAQPEKNVAFHIKHALTSQPQIWGALSFVIALYFLLRHFSMGDIYHRSADINYWYVAILQMQLPLEAIKNYIMVTILPFGRISIFYPISTLAINSPAALLGNTLALMATLSVMWLAILRQRPWAWLVLAAYVCIALVLHFIPMTIDDNVSQDRFMATGLAFFCIAIVLMPWRQWGIRLGLRASSMKLCAAILLGGWLILALATSITMTGAWENSLQLWAWTHKNHPDIRNVRHNYLHAALQHGRVDLVETEINRLMEKNNGLGVGEQILWSNTLIRKGDPESLKYIEGVLYALPKFHEMPDGKEKSKKFLLSRLSIAGAYVDYSNAKLLFDLDVDAAIEANRIAKWYLTPSQSGPAYYQEAALLYINGESSIAEKILKENEEVYYHNKPGLILGMRNIVARFCDRIEEKRESIPRKKFEEYSNRCKNLKGKEFFEKK